MVFANFTKPVLQLHVQKQLVSYTYFKLSITDQLAKLMQNIMQKGP